jgi:hypothetical protein
VGKARKPIDDIYGDDFMIKYIWIAFTVIFFLFALYHFCRATKALPKAPNTAGANKFIGVNVGIAEFIDHFNRYIEDLNRDTKKVNILTGIAYLVASATALFSCFLSA